jgi:hypothetical protein
MAHRLKILPNAEESKNRNRAGHLDADFGGEKVELNGAGFGFESGAVFGADGLAFLGELDAVLLAVGKNGDEAAGSGQQAIDGPGGEDGAFAELARPVQAEDAGGYVTEDWDLVGTKFHALTVRGHVGGGKELCRSGAEAVKCRNQASRSFTRSRF